MNPLVVEAMKKAAIAWLGVGDQPAFPVWCLWIEDSLYVVSGAEEQPAPGLARAAIATVTARGDHGGRIVSWPATVSRVDPGSELWTTVVPQLTAKRLNSVAAAELGERWAAQCVVTRLAPVGEEVGALPDGSLAAPPRPSPATRETRKPFRLHRVKGARDSKGR